jgi:hypothetical protein
MSHKDGTTTCHRYCTAYLVSNEKETDAVKRFFAARVVSSIAFPSNLATSATASSSISPESHVSR